MHTLLSPVSSVYAVACVTVVGKCNAKSCPDCVQVPRQQYCQQPLKSDQNVCSYSSSFQMQQQPLQNQTFAAHSQYYSSPGCHSQTMHFGRQAQSTQRHHSPLPSQYQRLVTASVANEYCSAWQQPGCCINGTANIGTTESTSEYCSFDDQRQAPVGKNHNHNMRQQRQLTNGFGTAAGMQRGFVGGQQQQSDCQTSVLDMNPVSYTHLTLPTKRIV